MFPGFFSADKMSRRTFCRIGCLMLNVCDVGRFCVYIFIVKYFCLGCFVQIGCFDHSAGFFVLRMFSLQKFYRRMFCSGCFFRRTFCIRFIQGCFVRIGRFPVYNLAQDILFQGIFSSQLITYVQYTLEKYEKRLIVQELVV